MTKKSKAVVIMAAGQGTRMKSKTTKLLHQVAGRPLIHYPIELGLKLGAERIVLVLGHQREAIEAYVSEAFADAPIESVIQVEQLGTAHAVLCAEPALADFEGDVIILSGDVPCLHTDILTALDTEKGDAPVGLVTMRLNVPNRYGRLIRDTSGNAQAIVEFADGTAEQREVEELNSGIYQVDAKLLFQSLSTIGADNAQGEFYLTDLVEIAARSGTPAQVVYLDAETSQWAVGVNNRVDLAAAEAQIQARLRTELMLLGVTMVDPSRVYVEAGVTVGPDTVLGPDVYLKGKTRVGAECHIEQGSYLIDSHVEDGTTIKPYCHLECARVGEKCVIGPYARLREGTVLDDTVKIGNFVETKKAHFEHGAKANHLSYVGDASVGAKANIGAGTITCNYDGYKKSKTIIGKGAFIGSDTQLVAPVRVGDGAVVGAGTTVTQDVPENALTVSRVKQTQVEDWATRKRERELRAEKDA